MLGLNNARINALEAENRILRDELDAANARANAMPGTALRQARRCARHGAVPGMARCSGCAGTEGHP